MLDSALIEQLRQHFSTLTSQFQLEVAAGEHPQKSELLELLQSLSQASTRISLSEGPAKTGLFFQILKDQKPTGIQFAGIPGGHEFTSLVLALLNADGKGRLPDAHLQGRIAALKGPIRLRTVISLTCTNCPDVVQALNQMALIHPDLEHQMVDGALIQDEINRLGIQGVPSVLAGDQLIHAGKADLVSLIEALEKHYGTKTHAAVNNERSPYDLLVIGAGPAGASAAIYSARKGLRVGVIARKIGGQVTETKAIENLISKPYTEGPILAEDLRKHMEHYAIELLENREVERLSSSENLHQVHIKGGETLSATQVIIASGAKWRELNVPGEKDYLGAGVHFCPHCDGPFYKGKKVAVIGGGNSGLEAALDLAGICSQVTVLEFADQLRADQVLIEKAQSLANVQILRGVQTKAVLGDGKKVQALSYEERSNGILHQLEIEGIFVQIGLAPNSAAFRDLLEINPRGEIVIDSHNRTSVSGIYAAGDVSTIPYKQIVIAVGEGAKASLAAFEDRMRG